MRGCESSLSASSPRNENIRGLRDSTSPAFIEWTVHDKLRHARLLGVRDDKAAREVTRET